MNIDELDSFTTGIRKKTKKACKSLFQMVDVHTIQQLTQAVEIHDPKNQLAIKAKRYSPKTGQEKSE